MSLSKEYQVQTEGLQWTRPAVDSLRLSKSNWWVADGRLGAEAADLLILGSCPVLVHCAPPSTQKEKKEKNAMSWVSLRKFESHNGYPNIITVNLARPAG